MPLLTITHTQGAFTDAQKKILAERLTHAILVAEVGADNEHGRPVANVIFQAVDAQTSWFIGGRIEPELPVGGRFIIEAVIPQGSSPQNDKTELHRAINEVISEVLGVDGTFPNRAGDWVLVREIPDGNWGVSGKTMSSAQIAEVVKTAPERVAYTEFLIQAEQRMRTAFGYPSGASLKTTARGDACVQNSINTIRDTKK